MGSVMVDNVTKMYGDEVGIKNMSLEVKENEFIVIVGPSGAGKTTTLKVIAGLLDVTEGKIYIDNNLVNNVAPQNRNVAMTFEKYSLYPHYTVFENMANPLKAPGKSMTQIEISNQVDRMAKMLEIDHLLDRYPKELSGGQKQRVSLGRAMVREPSVFLLDEPLSHVDAKVKHRMRVELNKLQRKLNATTIYVTHDYVEGLSLADRIVILNNGEIMQIETPFNIYNKPINEFVASHVGQPKINIFDAKINENTDKIILESYKEPEIKLYIENNKYEQIIREYDKDLIRVGIRPQYIDIEKSQVNNLNGEVYVYTPFVTYGVLTVKVGELLLTVMTEPSYTFEVGENIELNMDVNNIYLFDIDTGYNLEKMD